MSVGKAIVVLILVVCSIVAALGSASAGATCVSYTVTAPFLGTRSGNPCTPNLPEPFTQPFTDSHCGGVPPANTSFCVVVTVYTP